MGTSERRIKITLDTGCINTAPNSNLDFLYDLYKKGEVELYVPDGVVKDILNNEFSLSDIKRIPNTPKGKRVKERLKKIESLFLIRGSLQCGDDVYGRVGGTAGGKITDELEAKISQIINSKYDFEDIRILLLHISLNNDYFMTKNTRHFVKNGRREAFLKELSVSVITPEEFVRKYEKSAKMAED